MTVQAQPKSAPATVAAGRKATAVIVGVGLLAGLTLASVFIGSGTSRRPTSGRRCGTAPAARRICWCGTSGCPDPAGHRGGHRARLGRRDHPADDPEPAGRPEHSRSERRRLLRGGVRGGVHRVHRRHHPGAVLPGRGVAGLADRLRRGQHRSGRRHPDQAGAHRLRARCGAVRCQLRGHPDQTRGFRPHPLLERRLFAGLRRGHHGRRPLGDREVRRRHADRDGQHRRRAGLRGHPGARTRPDPETPARAATNLSTTGCPASRPPFPRRPAPPRSAPAGTCRCSWWPTRWASRKKARRW